MVTNSNLLNELIEIGLDDKIRSFKRIFFDGMRGKLQELTAKEVSRETMIKQLFDFVEKWEVETYFKEYR